LRATWMSDTGYSFSLLK
ncbi:hypothetical protein E2320_019961, partial [Naja naja]